MSELRCLQTGTKRDSRRITPCSHSAPRRAGRLRCSATRSSRETFRFASFIRSPGRARILEYKKRARRVGTSGKLLASLATSATHIRYTPLLGGKNHFLPGPPGREKTFGLGPVEFKDFFESIKSF